MFKCLYQLAYKTDRQVDIIQSVKVTKPVVRSTGRGTSYTDWRFHDDRLYKWRKIALQLSSNVIPLSRHGEFLHTIKRYVMYEKLWYAPPTRQPWNKGTFFNKSSEYPWEQSVPLSLLILSLILCVRVYTQTYGRQNSSGSKAFNLAFRIIDDSLSINNPKIGFH